MQIKSTNRWKITKGNLNSRIFSICLLFRQYVANNINMVNRRIEIKSILKDVTVNHLFILFHLFLLLFYVYLFI